MFLMISTLLMNSGHLQSVECYVRIVTVDVVIRQVLHYAIHFYMFYYLCSVVSISECKKILNRKDLPVCFLSLFTNKQYFMCPISYLLRLLVTFCCYTHAPVVYDTSIECT